jgi:hypothetical protein
MEPLSCLDVSAAVNQSNEYRNVVAACRPVQRRFSSTPPHVARAGVSTSRDPGCHDCRTVGKVARPIGRHVQQSPGTNPRGRQTGIVTQKAVQFIQLAAADRRGDGDSERVNRTEA